MTVLVAGHTIVLFAYDGSYFAIDNRCPHMGFPLDQGTVKDGILTCHWHHARFDLDSGGTFDQWADDVRSFPVEIQDGEIWVDLGHQEDPFEHQRRRLLVGLQRDIPLVIGKAVLKLFEEDRELREPFCDGLEFGTGFRREGWGQGLTILTCMMNMTPFLDEKDKPRTQYHGLSAVSRDSIGSAPRFGVWPLPDEGTPIATLRRWFRQFIEVRDAEGAERCLISAVATGADDMQMADMLFSAATDHRYIQSGHVLDFTNKALEALDTAYDGFLDLIDVDKDGIISLGELETLVLLLRQKDIRGTFHGELVVEMAPEVHHVNRGQANRECEQCHNPESEFFSQVYICLNKDDGTRQHHPVERRVLESYYVNHFYAISGTRVRMLDKIGLALIVGGLSVVAGHLFVRVATAPARRRRKEKKDEFSI